MEDIVREGHPALRKKSKKLDLPVKREDKDLLKKMITFLKNSQDDELAEKYKLRAGVGLAAPQLGINKQMIAVHFKDKDEKNYSYQLINPKIISHSVQQSYLPGGEGCLSVDREVEGYVIRYARITVRAHDINNEEITLRLRGYPAIVFQHEIDHLNGIMFYDHISKENPFSVPDQAKPIET